MEERFTLAEGRGELTATEEANRVRFRARLADDGRGLYKAYLLGGRGRFLLGTLVPEGGALALTRTVSRGELERRGVWPPTGAAAELAFSFQKEGPAPPPPGWRREECPERLMGDALLRESARGLRGALLRREGEGFRLALPWREDRAFGLVPLFCFASVEQVGAETCAIFTFNGHGCPVFA